MKTIISLTRPLALTITAMASLMTTTLAQQVSISDSGLDAAIRDALQIPTGPLTEQDLLRLIKLDASSRNVSSVDGLAAARNLSVLFLDSNQLTNFVLPGTLTNLTELDVSFNPLTNCTLPSGLANLSTLGLNDNQLTQFAFPAGLTNLSFVGLSGNQLTSLTLPPDMTQLTTLFVDGNPFTSLVLSEPLAAANMADTITSLRAQNITVVTYPLTVQIVALRQIVGGFQFAVTGPPGVYSILASTDLAAWNELATVTNTQGFARFEDLQANLSPRKFYLARTK